MWLPRACGDGPRQGVAVRISDTAPPRLRGWTRAYSGTLGRQQGSPAPAGMDPRTIGSRTYYAGLPRACGDGPLNPLMPRPSNRAPPRLRGWTPTEPDAPPPHRGSPAPAGMDPAGASAPATVMGLPRACGDGPALDIRNAEVCLAPPRLRGWTLYGDTAGKAEWAPPRLRGWTPHKRGQLYAHSGSPAPAGMDPRTSLDRPAARRLPRACGDGPRRWPGARSNQLAPPRLRGWTHLIQAGRGQVAGSPAPAGMDPG